MQANDVVEDFTLQDQDGNAVTLSSFKDKPVVLFFYPRADTPGCTVEACNFRDNFSKLQAAGAVLLGISRDKVKAQKKFADKFSLNYPLLADPDETICNYFGVLKPKSMYGKLVKGIERTTFVIAPADSDGEQKILHVFEKVKPEGHADEVLALLEQHARQSGHQTQ
ncbi:MAG TPA: thioredoxin-dependent thiol peroxidase [Acidobacteriaceae bacterium]|jgi:peroxiredoxin Q/BCP|nr:thioredoxin-dependent thiol peroxidase [Acidobacteriaceae bacterium]